MNLNKEKFKISAAMGIFASICNFIILFVIFVLAVFGIFSSIDSSTGPDSRIKGFIDFFDHPGFNGFTLLEMFFVINAGLFVLSLFFFIRNRRKKDNLY